MILPIRSYGDPVLKKVARDIKPGHPGLKQLIADIEKARRLQEQN